MKRFPAGLSWTGWRGFSHQVGNTFVNRACLVVMERVAENWVHWVRGA